MTSRRVSEAQAKSWVSTMVDLFATVGILPAETFRSASTGGRRPDGSGPTGTDPPCIRSFHLDMLSMRAVSEPGGNLVRSARRIVATSLLALVAVAGTAVQAMAGGSIAEVKPRSWARQGSEIRLSGTFCNGSQGPVGSGPWFAYLDPRTGPPVLIGRVDIAPNTGNYCHWRLTATLRVPQVAVGRYWLQVCDRGCKNGVGDLIGAGWFVVASAESPREQALRLEALRARLRDSMREQARQERSLGEVQRSLTRAEAEALRLGTLADSLRDQLADERDERGAWFGGAVASTAVLLAVLSVLVIWRRRRRSRVRVPDTPAELVEMAHTER
jgi:hypothetical protein